MSTWVPVFQGLLRKPGPPAGLQVFPILKLMLMIMMMMTMMMMMVATMPTPTTMMKTTTMRTMVL